MPSRAPRRDTRGRPLLRICVEHLPPAALARPAVVRLLTARGIAPMLAMRVEGGADLTPAFAALRPYVDAGLPACAWPLLDDADGYWPSVGNAPAFHRAVRALLDAAERARLPLPWIAVDLEPPLAEVERARRSLVGLGADLVRVTLADANRSRAAFAEAERLYAALHKELAHRRTRAVAIAYPPATADFATAGSSVLSRLVGAPLRCGWDAVAVMTYGSLLAGWSGGLLDEEDVRHYAFRALSELSDAVGARAGAFIGLVGHGKLGDEPAYADPAALREDASMARAAGCGEVSLFCLEGVLATPHPEAWLDAFAGGAAAPRVPPFRLRGEVLHRSMHAARALLAVAAATVW